MGQDSVGNKWEVGIFKVLEVKSVVGEMWSEEGCLRGEWMDG